MHQKDQKHLAKEIYKFLKGLSPPVMNDLGTLLTTSEIFSDCIPTIRKLLNIEPKLLHMEGAQMWNLVPESMRNTPSSNTFLKLKC